MSVKIFPGMTFGDLTVISKHSANKTGLCAWYCRCTCGELVVRSTTMLTSGKATHCGCKDTVLHCKYADDCFRCPLPDCNTSIAYAAKVNRTIYDREAAEREALRNREALPIDKMAMRRICYK